MNRSWILGMVLLLLLLSGCRKSAEPAGTLFVSGRIDGDTVDISSKTEGKVEDLTVREGDSVEAGQRLAWLTSPQDEAQREAQKANVVYAERKLAESEAAAPARVTAAEANLEASKANLEASKASLDVSKAELVRWQAELQQTEIDAKRYPPLVSTGAVAAQTSEQFQTKVKTVQASTDASRQQVTAAEAAVGQSKAALEQSKASLQQAKAELEQIATSKANLAASRAELQRIEANVSDLTITAPIAGTILTRSAEPGRVIQPGQTILTMVDLHKLYLRGFIPEGEIGKVKVGQQAQVYLDSNPKEGIPGEVIRIDPEAMFTPENIYFQQDRVTQVVGVKVLLRGAYGFAKPGMPADGRIQIGTP